MYHSTGYEELYKFLNLLGTVFGWVASDVDAKMEILRGHKNGESGDKYLTVQSMVQHEIENDMIKHKAKDSSTGTRNLLRLHRALEYIVAFLEGVPSMYKLLISFFTHRFSLFVTFLTSNKKEILLT